MKKNDGGQWSAHYISGTHWDREWYRPFQEFRLLLTDILDELLTLMERDTDFRYFHLDGQTCPLDDYLTVRGSYRVRLEKLIAEGRILIGPWFTMPDLFAPGQEALIRNLLLGSAVCAEWNVQPMPVAYTCDMFGHPEQMPQIYRGFQLNDCVLGRGTNEATTPAFFQWKAPDGSEVTVFKLQDYMGYGAFTFTRNLLEKEKNRSEQTLEKAADGIAGYIRHEMKRSDLPVLCLIDALDHQPPAKEVDLYLSLIKKKFPGMEVRHSTLPAFFDEVHNQKNNLPLREGELREPAIESNPYNWLIPNCTSSRVRMKAANDRCEALLQRWAEPLAVCKISEGMTENDRSFFRKAWELLLLNHAHDSICGCSLDQVHRDMMYRYDQVEILAKQLRNRTFAAYSNDAQELGSLKDEFTLVIGNPLPFPRKEVITFSIDLPTDYPYQFTEGFPGSQNIKAFTLRDCHGNNIPYQRLSLIPELQEPTRLAVPSSEGGDGVFTRYEVAAEVEIPPLGYTSLAVIPSEKPVRRLESLRTGPLSAGNEFLEMSINGDGTVSVTDLENGEVYNGLLRFEDTSEIGSGWFHSRTANDEYLLTGSPERISVFYEGPEATGFRIRHRLNVPQNYDWRKELRSSETTEVIIDSRVVLFRGKKELDVTTEITNNAEDHCLRLLLPTETDGTAQYRAHTPFAMTARTIRLDEKTADGRESEIPEKPFRHLLRLSNEKRGLAFISSGGLHEGGVRDDKARTMMITMLRSFRRTVGTSGESDGLEKGKITYRYKIIPVSDAVSDVVLLQRQQVLETGLITRQSGPLRSGYAPLPEKGKREKSFLHIKRNRLLLSALKPAEDGRGFIVRLWNPAPIKIEETLEFSGKVISAEYTTLSEKTEGKRISVIDKKTFSVEAGKNEIITLRVQLEG